MWCPHMLTRQRFPSWQNRMWPQNWGKVAYIFSFNMHMLVKWLIFIQESYQFKVSQASIKIKAGSEGQQGARILHNVLPERITQITTLHFSARGVRNHTSWLWMEVWPLSPNLIKIYYIDIVCCFDELIMLSSQIVICIFFLAYDSK